MVVKMGFVQRVAASHIGNVLQRELQFADIMQLAQGHWLFI